MGKKKRITEYLDIDLEREMWCCHKCNCDIISARDNYKRGCLIYPRDPSTIYPKEVDGEYTFSPDPEWCTIVEFYCPGCGIMIENEYLPVGHPITHDIALDITKLKEKYLNQ